MRGKKRVRVLAVVGVVAVVASLTLPATGKKPTPVSDTVSVTMSFEEAGIATSCGAADPIVMNRGRNGTLRVDWAEANTDVEIALPIKWSRNHPGEGSDGDELTGCHGAALDSSGEGYEGEDPLFEGYFILEPVRDGHIELTSRFDYYWEYGPVTKGKNTRTGQTVLEFFEINAELAPDGTTAGWSGELELWSFEKLVDGGPGWTSLGKANITMTITIDEP